MDKPRCDRHKDSAKLPALCGTCQRIHVEQQIVTRVVEDLLTTNRVYGLASDTDEDKRPSTDSARVLASLMTVDDEYLLVYGSETKVIGWVRFVYGNGGYDVISDYTTNLDDVLEPIMAFTQTFEA